MRSRSNDFWGRESAILALHEALTTYGAVALIGPDNSGKTQTAIHYTQQHAIRATWSHTQPAADTPSDGLRIVYAQGLEWPTVPTSTPLLVLSEDAPADLPYPIVNLDPLPDAVMAEALEANGYDGHLAPHLGGSPLALRLLLSSDGDVGLPADTDALTVLLGWHWRHLGRAARYLWQVGAAFRHEPLVPLARLRWMMGWEDAEFQAALSSLHHAGLISVEAGWVDVHARAILARLWQAPGLLSATQRLVTAYRQPEFLQEQADERGLAALRQDLDALAHLLPSFDDLHRLRRLLASDMEPVVLQVRERAHHQGEHELRVACDTWLTDYPHFYTEAVWHYPTPSRQVWDGHSHRVTSITPIGTNHLITTAHDGLLRLWNADTGQLRWALESHQGGATCTAQLTPYTALSGGVDTALRLWDLRTGDLLKTLKGHEWPVTALVRVDDCHVISASADDTLRLWDIETGTTLRIFKGHTEPIADVALLDEAHMLSGSHDGTARLWHIATGETLRIFKGHGASVTCVAWSPHGRVVTGSSDKTVRLWDVETGITVREFGGHGWPVQDVALWGDNRLISAADTIRVWDMSNGVLARTLEGHTRPVTALATLNERYLVSGSADTQLCVWDMLDAGPAPTPAPHQDWVTAVVGLQYPYGASASADNQLALWNLEQGALIQRIPAHEDGIHALVNLGGGNLATASADHTLRVWHWALDENGPILKGHQDEVTAAVVLNTQWLVSGSADKTVRVWDCWAGECLQVLSGHPARITALATLNEQQIIVGDALGNIWLWDLGRAAVVQRFSGYPSAVSALVVMGETVWAAGHDHAVWGWHLAAQQPQVALHGHQDWVTALAPLDDAPLLVSASFDGTLRLWDVQQGEAVTMLRLDAPILSLDYLGQRRLMVGDASGKVRVMGTRLPR